MKTRRPPDLARDSRGFTLPELLVTVAIFGIVGLGAGSLYLSTTRAMDEGSTMVYLQRQGTQIQDELARHIQRATVLEVDPYGASQSLCQPSSGVNLLPGKSIIYKRTVGTAGNPTSPSTDEFWCVYEYRRPADFYAQLWRCQVSGLTPPQVCSTNPENLVMSALRGFLGLPIGVSDTCFRPEGLDPLVYPIPSCIPPAAPIPLPCAGCPPSVEVTFALDVKRDPNDPTYDPHRSSVLGLVDPSSRKLVPRQFGFNITIRN